MIFKDAFAISVSSYTDYYREVFILKLLTMEGAQLGTLSRDLGPTLASKKGVQLGASSATRCFAEWWGPWMAVNTEPPQVLESNFPLPCPAGRAWVCLGTGCFHSCLRPILLRKVALS